jgi:hypothetical protein
MYSDRTVPFESAFKLTSHFLKHGHKFGARTEAEYEQMAEAFMSKPVTADIFECVSPHGRHDRNRLEGSTLYFGVAYGLSTIYTFHPRTLHGVTSKGGPLQFVLAKCAEVKV